ncbi:CPA_1a_G0002320.mRNA.1.CDS.1 [Saccharomyces cerevisiae]|nr:CPA_1a_G0002320.mRNA.1.CDS.1 [Saccharomyces cerevisiae]CAI7140806.1 CPA_1a_G0002320.mRNA.1.CDS.1 [Saccharomyces cerevisiae]
MSKTAVKDSATEKTKLAESEQHYFNSYDHYGIHEEMLQDTVRTLSYRNAIIQNKDFFKDKIVLDVGCGTGILSMFAAKHGAKHVIGVDMSSIIEMAKELVELNGFSDKITLLRGKLEDVHLPFPKVDIIISEWMGYFLLYESMMDTVLYARDHYLVEGGLIFPDKCSIHLAGLEDSQYKDEKLNYWQDVYGFDYSAICSVIKISDLAFKSNFKLTAKRQDMINGIVTWFDIVFPAPKGKRPVEFSTGPHAPYTHWKQTIFYFPDDLDAETGDTIEGELVCSPNEKNNRDLNIKISYKFESNGIDGNSRSRKNKGSYLMH